MSKPASRSKKAMFIGLAAVAGISAYGILSPSFSGWVHQGIKNGTSALIPTDDAGSRETVTDSTPTYTSFEDPVDEPPTSTRDKDQLARIGASGSLTGPAETDPDITGDQDIDTARESSVIPPEPDLTPANTDTEDHPMTAQEPISGHEPSQENADVPESNFQKARRQAVMSSPIYRETVTAIGSRVSSLWQAPAGDLSQEASIVEVSISLTGELEEVSITRSSGMAAYDQSVLRAARAAAPFQEIRRLDPLERFVMATFYLSFGNPDALPPRETHSPDANKSAFGADNQASSTPPSPSTNSTGGALTASNAYINDVIDRIGKVWQQPVVETLTNAATLMVKLAVPMGSVISAEVIRPSGNQEFDASATEAVIEAAPYRGLQNLSIDDQQAVSQFLLHFDIGGIHQ